ncbi:hypothetical protein [Kitasatospora sp. NPDC050543]|uniref:hypothetical protein n=1 Tax=Kitasatospora sp. NPDC050543 TaxID=3364054 RepID=UPI00378A88D2
MPLRPSRRPALALAAALLLTTGCAAAGSSSADRAGSSSADRAGASRELSAAELRAAALGDSDMGPGYTVTVMTPGHGETGRSGEREAADLPACQPVLDAVTPANPASRPVAETDLSVAAASDPKGSVYAGLLAYGPGRATQLQAELERVLGQCTAFSSAAPAAGKGGATGRQGGRTRHRLSRDDAPTPGGADGVTGFTLTNESGTAVLSQRAVLVRVGSVLAVFSTVGVGAEPATVPDERVVRQQVAKLRAAQAGR